MGGEPGSGTELEAQAKKSAEIVRRLGGRREVVKCEMCRPVKIKPGWHCRKINRGIVRAGSVRVSAEPVGLRDAPIDGL